MKEQMQKKYNRFNKIIKKSEEKKTKEERKKKNSTELQNPNIEAEVYNNNKKCD